MALITNESAGPLYQEATGNISTGGAGLGALL
jgi:hypothetical protein